MPQWDPRRTNPLEAWIFILKGGTPLGHFFEIAPVVSHSENSFWKLYLYFQRWDTTGAFFKLPQWCPTLKIHFRNCVCIVRGGTPLGHFLKLPQWCPTLKIHFRNGICIFRGGTPLGHFLKLPQWCPTLKIHFRKCICIFRGGTPLGHFLKLPQWCPTLKIHFLSKFLSDSSKIISLSSQKTKKR